MSDLDILLVTAPGLEQALKEEAKAAGFKVKGNLSGGVSISGGWPEVWRANLVLRGAARVLVRIGSFYAAHLAQLDKRARTFPWHSFLRKDASVSVETTCRKSKIYHSGAASQRIETALREEAGLAIRDDGDIAIKARIENDLVTLSIDTTGEPLHKRGHKQAMAKAPLRENMAALFLRQCGYDGHMPVVDPMCGSGTFILEAAEWAAGLAPGRSRNFAFEKLAAFDEAAWQTLKQACTPRILQAMAPLIGSDRDAGAIKASQANAERAGVGHITQFMQRPVSALVPPDGKPGLVICNPPYGTRLGEEKKLRNLYETLGSVLLQNFAGWRVGIITSNERLARATNLPFDKPMEPVLHGGLRVRLYCCSILIDSLAPGPANGPTKLQGQAPSA